MRLTGSGHRILTKAPGASRTSVSSLTLVFVLTLVTTAFPQKHTLSGKITNAASGDSLPAVNIRILGTSRGTISNEHGRYSLVLNPGNYVMLFSSLSFRPDTEAVGLFSDTRLDVALTPADIVLPEVTVTAEDPAIGIIRRAIANKRRWIDRLTSYEMEAFTRQVIMRDTAIASITESYSTGYWEQGDTLREVITQRRQTANIQPAFNFASVGRVLNFNDDEIRFAGYAFVGPTAHDALDHYDYRLLQTRTSRGREVYHIRMIPRTRTVPLFEGTIDIASGSYALAGIDVQPNEAFRIPFVKDMRLRYRQDFGLYDSTFWMPTDIRIDASLLISIIGFSFPGIGFNQTSVVYNYRINIPLPDSVFAKPRVVIDSSAAKIDSSFWATNNVLPLSPKQEDAYRTLDSTRTLEVQFRPGGISATLSFGEGGEESLISFADLSFNRVEGLHAGIRQDFDSLWTLARFSGGFSYGTADKKTKYVAGLTLFSSRDRRFGAGAEIYRRIDHTPDQGYYGPLANSLAALLAKDDYNDYYLAKGWRAFATVTPSHLLALEVSFVSQTEMAVAARTNFSILFPSRTYRPNPPAAEGRLRSLRLNARIGPPHVPLDLITTDGVDIAVEHSSPRIEGGDFEFTQISGVATITFPTFARSYLLPPGVRARIAAGASSGTLPTQRLFSLESALAGEAQFGVLYGARPKEFSGTRYVTLSLEHNFRTIPFLALGIPFLYENNLELILHGAAGRTWGTDGVPLNITDRIYSEAGLGISRIFDLFRVDITRRFMKPAGVFLTMAVASFF